MPANNSSTHHYLLIFKSQFYVNNKQIHLEADPSAHRLHRHSHRHHPRRHQLHGHVMTIAAGINHDARPFPFRCTNFPRGEEGLHNQYLVNSYSDGNTKPFLTYSFKNHPGPHVPLFFITPQPSDTCAA